MPQIAAPVAVTEAALKLASLVVEKKRHALRCLITIAFYYLLRSGKYTKPHRIKQNGQLVRGTRTIQFQVQYIGFWKDGKVLPIHSPLECLLIADSPTMDISNEKNGRMGQTLNNKYIGPRGEVAVLSRRVSHIPSHRGTEDHLLYDYLQTKTWEAVHRSAIVAAVRGAEKSLKLHG